MLSLALPSVMDILLSNLIRKKSLGCKSILSYVDLRFTARNLIESINKTLTEKFEHRRPSWIKTLITERSDAEVSIRLLLFYSSP